MKNIYSSGMFSVEVLFYHGGLEGITWSENAKYTVFFDGATPSGFFM